jgi:hypothetical protein
VIFGGKAPLTGINSNGIVGGFQAGANWQVGALVGGLEIDLSATGIKGATSALSTAANGQQNVSISQTQTDKFELLGSARGRLGYVVWPNVLLYGMSPRRKKPYHQKLCNNCNNSAISTSRASSIWCKRKKIPFRGAPKSLETPPAGNYVLRVGLFFIYWLSARG